MRAREKVAPWRTGDVIETVRRAAESCGYKSVRFGDRPNERWSMDFLLDTLADGRPYRIWALVEDAMGEAPLVLVDRSLPAAARELGVSRQTLHRVLTRRKDEEQGRAIA